MAIKSYRFVVLTDEGDVDEFFDEKEEAIKYMEESGEENYELFERIGISVKQSIKVNLTERT